MDSQNHELTPRQQIDKALDDFLSSLGNNSDVKKAAGEYIKAIKKLANKPEIESANKPEIESVSRELAKSFEENVFGAENLAHTFTDIAGLYYDAAVEGKDTGMLIIILRELGAMMMDNKIDEVDAKRLEVINSESLNKDKVERLIDTVSQI